MGSYEPIEVFTLGIAPGSLKICPFDKEYEPYFPD
jgi:hypothetical protein